MKITKNDYVKCINLLSSDDFDFIFEEKTFLLTKNFFYDVEAILNLNKEKEIWFNTYFSKYADWDDFCLNGEETRFRISEKQYEKIIKSFDDNNVDGIVNKMYTVSIRLKDNVNIERIVKTAYQKNIFSLGDLLEEKELVRKTVGNFKKIAKNNVYILVELPETGLLTHSEITPVEKAILNNKPSECYPYLLNVVKEKLQNIV